MTAKPAPAKIARHRVTTPAGHQTTYRGTREQAEAYAALQGMHDTHPDYAATFARLNGK